MHLDWATSKFITKQWQIGLVGYVFNQLSCDSGAGDRVGCFKSRVMGVGPQIGYIFPLGTLQGYINLKGLKWRAEPPMRRAAGLQPDWNVWRHVRKRRNNSHRPKRLFRGTIFAGHLFHEADRAHWGALEQRQTGAGRSPSIPDRAGSGIGRRMGGELAVEFPKKRNAIRKAKLGAGGGERGIRRRRGAVDDEARAGKRLKDRREGRIAHRVHAPRRGARATPARWSD